MQSCFEEIVGLFWRRPLIYSCLAAQHSYRVLLQTMSRSFPDTIGLFSAATATAAVIYCVSCVCVCMGVCFDMYVCVYI